MSSYIRNYEILRELGAGHFGAVYLCVGETPARGPLPGKRRLVAIKRLKDSTDNESVRLLLQEFALLDQVKHRGIVRVFEYLDEERAVVMEHVHGVTLRELLDACAKKKEQVFTEAAVEIGCEIADALYQAWTTPSDNGEKLQLVHRDLKPENVILTANGEVKILDFGLARVDNSDFAKEDASRIRGTPVYMAPEQARGEEIDHRADLFALGLILYELLMGRPAYRIPMDAKDPVAAVFAAIEGGELGEQIRELETKLPGMGPIVARLLQARPRNRYPTGQDLLVDLRRQLYKDRGAYLKEFCSFLFGGIIRLPELPNIEGGQGGTMSSTDKRKTIEERLRESLDRSADEPPDANAPKAPVPVRRVPRVGGPTADAAPNPTPRAAPPMVAAPHAPPKIVPRSQSAARPAPPAELDDIMPPSVKGKPAGGAKPAPAGPRKMVGARSPDETGMLQMVPLNDNEDEKEAAGDPSATAFFAIPAPKAERPKSQGPMSMSGSPVSNPTPMQPSSNSMNAPAPFQPPSIAPMNSQPQSMGPQSMGPQSMAQPMVQGPVVGYPQSGGNTPFQVSGPQPTQSANVESRMQSTRVLAVVLAAVGMLCVALLLTVVAIFLYNNKKEDKPAPPQITQNEIKPPAPKPPKGDTGMPAPKPQANKPPKPRPQGGGTPSAPAAPRVGPTGTVSVTFSGSPTPTQVEITCGSGFRQRGGVSGGSASIANVPTGEDCKLFPKGVVATAFTVRGAHNYNCSFSGTTMSCK